MLRYFIIEVRRLRADPEDQRQSLLHQREIREEREGTIHSGGNSEKRRGGIYTPGEIQRRGERELFTPWEIREEERGNYSLQGKF